MKQPRKPDGKNRESNLAVREGDKFGRPFVAQTPRMGVCPRGGAGLAQLVEHMICNHGVAGSSPAAGTKEFKGLREFCVTPLLLWVTESTVSVQC